MESTQKALEEILLGRTIETVEYDERYARNGAREITLKLTFDNGHSMEFHLGNRGDGAPPMRAM